MWSNLRSANDRVSRRTVLSAIGAGLFASSAGCVHPLPPPQGVLIQKGIFGEHNDRRVPVLKAGNNEIKIEIEDKVLQSEFPRSNETANTTVSPSLHNRLKRKYDDVHYYAQVRRLNGHGPLVETNSGEKPRQPAVGGTPRYLLSREIFGKLLSGDRIEYTLAMFDSQRISAVTLIIREGVVRKKFPEADTPGNVPSYRITVDHGEGPDGAPFLQTYYASEEVYNNATVDDKTYFEVIFENRVKPTIRSLSPDPYGSL
ncbi:hypothetical protein [Halocatena pleomorpha]|uniref:Uncharacterized protein n=1 Tax=Halocatena pleomorpha TaxID=1785090 RepID=A0A3P3RKN3_9EURY|nr:hypothetical protein [Halocatena pleomorpha]RRJ33420.1 hypothetical protein EIK79_01025 [Halocatena pleomorpha]